MYFSILWFSILPLIVFAAIGWWLDSHFKIDINTLGRLQGYVVLPIFVFYSLYLAVPSSDLIYAGGAWIAACLLISLFSFAAGKIHSLPERILRTDLSVFGNLGQLAIPFVLILYSHIPFAEGQSMPYLTETRSAAAFLFLINSVLLSVPFARRQAKNTSTAKEFLFCCLRNPCIYAALLAVAIRWAGLQLEHTFIWSVLLHFTGALVVLALVSLGIEVRRSVKRKWTQFHIPPGIFKLIGAPVLALILLALFPVSHAIAQVFLIFSAMPATAAIPLSLTAIREKKAGAEIFCSTTVLSFLTVWIWTVIAQILFPL